MYQDIKNIYHYFVATLANVYFSSPSKKIKVIGVTGTDGKTTTVSLIYHILNKSGKKTSMLTSIGGKISGKEIDTGFHVTTPSPFALQRIIKKAVDYNSEYFVLEVTSHSIDQFRIKGISFEIGVITNVSPEHLDYHKNYSEYVSTKEKLLLKSNIAIANKDDNSFKYLTNIKNLTTFGFGKDADINPGNENLNLSSIEPEFNKYNYLAAYSACKSLKLSDQEINSALKTFKMPKGRYDFVYKKDFYVVIDFAHTPNSIDKLLSTLKSKNKGRLIHVFGSAGERDRNKRPHMGANSSKYSDLIILTAEDPRKEKVDQISKEIENGITNKTNVEKIDDRSKAIGRAISIARKGDIIAITGKGHERSMTYGKEDVPWDEYRVVEKALLGKNNHE